MIYFYDVKKSFPGRCLPVIDNLSFKIEKGEFCVLIGANGCGKSTLMKLINAEMAADSGSIIKKGQVAQVVQDTHLGTVPEMTLLENIALSEIQKPRLAFYSRYRRKIIEKLEEIGIGLEQYIDTPVKYLSGGQRQLIATVMAINSQKPILLLDEHTSALDPKMQQVLMSYTAYQIEAHSLTVMMITHKMDDAIKYGNRLMMLHQGRLVLDMGREEKNAMTPQKLLRMFHDYEDQLLMSKEL